MFHVWLYLFGLSMENGLVWKRFVVILRSRSFTHELAPMEASETIYQFINRDAWVRDVANNKNKNNLNILYTSISDITSFPKTHYRTVPSIYSISDCV